MSASAFRFSLRSVPVFALLMGSVFSVPALAATSAGWATTKVDKSAVPYCAVSRQIDTLTVTVGRNVQGESSLAVEFAGDELDPKKTYKVAIKPGGAERIELEARPLNARTFVFNLDHVVDLKETFLAAPTLQLRYDDTTSTLSMGEWSDAAQDMESCMAALTGAPAPIKVAKTAADAPTQKTETKQKAEDTDAVLAAPDTTVASGAAPMPTVSMAPAKKEDTKKTAPGKAVSVEPLPPGAKVVGAVKEVPVVASKMPAATDLKVPPPMKEIPKVMAAADGKTVSVPAPEREEVKNSSPVQNGLMAQLTSAKEELRAARDELAALQARQAAAEKKAGGDVEALALMKQIKDLQVKNDGLVQELNALRTDVVAKAKTAQASADQMKAQELSTKDRTALEGQIAALQAQVNAQQKMKTDFAALQAERDTLRAKLDETIRAGVDNPALGPQIAGLKAQLEKLESDNNDLRAKMAGMSAVSSSPDVNDLRRRLEVLTSENVKLRGDLAAAKTPGGDMKVTVAAERPLRVQLRELQKQNDSLVARQSELEKSLEGAQRSNEKDELKSVKGDQDMERAMRRLQEAEREVQRLSMALRDQRTQCEAQKKEIEYMLFDPKTASDGQIALLNSLEDQIAELKAGQKSASDLAAAACPAIKSSAVAAGSAPSVADQAERAAMQKKLADLQMENQKLRTDLNVAQNVASALKSSASAAPTPTPVTPPAAAPNAAALPDLTDVARRMEALTIENAKLQSDLENAAVRATQVASVAPVPSVPATPVAITPLPEPSAKEAVWTAPSQDKMPGASGAPAGGTLGALENLLARAGIMPVNAPAPLSKNPFGNGAAYKWETDSLVGLWAQRKGVDDFNTAVSDALARLKSVCKGEFAASNASSGSGLSAYDVACIAGANSTSAAVVFYERGKNFYMMSHESVPDDMGKAMDARDAAVRALGQKDL